MFKYPINGMFTQKLVVEENLKRNDVNVLSIDDVNLRKGNSSTACSVFIDAETHRVLVIV